MSSITIWVFPCRYRIAYCFGLIPFPIFDGLQTVSWWNRRKEAWIHGTLVEDAVGWRITRNQVVHGYAFCSQWSLCRVRFITSACPLILQRISCVWLAAVNKSWVVLPFSEASLWLQFLVTSRWCSVSGFKLELVGGLVRLDLGFEAEPVDRRVRLGLGFETDGQALFFGPPINLKEGFGMSKLSENVLNARERTHKFWVLE